MEAYLDWQSKSGGIKLNDVIEEYRYVANGKKVKKGYFLTYVGEDVAPATEPPFNAVALSSGVGAPEYVEQETAYTGNAFKRTWSTKNSTEYIANDGTVMTTSGTGSSTSLMSSAVDEKTNTYHISNNTYEYWFQFKFVNPAKISSMKVQIYTAYDFAGGTAKIQGSNNGTQWTDLSTLDPKNNTLVTKTLSNVDFYQYYRIYAYHDGSGGGQAPQYSLYEWQTTEYIEKTIVPSTEHNEQVKIARLPIEIAKAGNIFPTSWEEESTTKIVASDGTTLEASSYNSSGYLLSYACDNSTDTTWKSGDYGTAWLKIKLPAAQKITKMKYYAYPNNGDINVIIQGSNDDSKWDDLYETSEKQNSLREIILNNPDYYQYYKLVVECSTSGLAYVYEWQTSEYVEVI